VIDLDFNRTQKWFFSLFRQTLQTFSLHRTWRR